MAEAFSNTVMPIDCHALGATRFSIGLSAICAVYVEAFEKCRTMKVIAGNGVLEVVSKPMALSGASCIGWGLGYPIGTDEVIGFYTKMYLAASGQTMTVAILNGFALGKPGL